MILVIINVFSLCAFAQSKHTSVWNIDNYILNFDASSVCIEENNDFLDKDILYVDSNGKLKLILDFATQLLQNTQFETVRGIEKINEPIQFVAPSPNNCNQVYAFGYSKYVLVDIEKNEIIGDIISLNELNAEGNLILFNHILVHHSNCRDIWLIYYNTEVMYKYLLTSSGIEYKDTKRINWQYNNPRRNGDMVINLSNDCKHYTANLLGDSIVCYGDFDRQTGDFIRKSEVIMRARPQFTKTNVLNSLISKDNKTIYYYCAPHTKEYQYSSEIISVDIVDGIPDYNNLHVLYSSIIHDHYYAFTDVFYGYDGNIYIVDPILKIMYRMTISREGNVVVDDRFLTFQHVSYTEVQNFLADWFSPNPCGENCDCPELKKPVIICE